MLSDVVNAWSYFLDNVRRIIRSGEMMTLSSDRHFGYATVVRSFAKHSWRSYAPHIAQNERSEILRNVSVYEMFFRPKGEKILSEK